MKIIKIHYKLSKPIKKYNEIKDEAKLLLRFVERGKFEGFYNKAYAISHKQVNEKPYAFFVVAQECINEKMFKNRIIINPKILKSDKFKKIGTVLKKANKISNIVTNKEMCLSFPFRKPKDFSRFDSIKVRYQIPTLFGLKTITDELFGIASQIFQHELDHIQGRNIYIESYNQIKWWELFGKPLSN